MRQKITKLVGLVQLVFAIILALSLNFASSRPTVAQTDTETVWEEGRPVTGEGSQLDSVSLLAVPTVPGTYYRTFSGTAFQPTASAMTFAPIGGAVYVTALPAGGFSLSYDMNLPHGATITEVVFFVVDNNAANFGLSLRSYNPETNSFLTLESGISAGESAALQTIILPVNPPIVVDNPTTSYRLRVAPGVATSAHLLYGARVGYTVPTTFLPLVER
jgi:hypothetical protein